MYNLQAPDLSLFNQLTSKLQELNGDTPQCTELVQLVNKCKQLTQSYLTQIKQQEDLLQQKQDGVLLHSVEHSLYAPIMLFTC